MQLQKITEVVWKYYQEGRVSATNAMLRKPDVAQMVLMAFGSALRERFYQGKNLDEGTDFIGGDLDVREMTLGDANRSGMRRAVMADTDEVIRLPRATDIVNVSVVGESSCAPKDWDGTLTQVQPGEENFYAGDPDMKHLYYFVQKGRGINTYNLPDCITKIMIERIFVSDTMDVPMDIAYEVATQVLGVTLKVKGISPMADNALDGNRNELKYQLELQNAKTI